MYCFLLLRTYFFFSCICLLPLLSYSQEITLSKRSLKKIFHQNVKGTTHGWKRKKWANSSNQAHKDAYNKWSSCNKDSLYYNSDTLIMYNYDGAPSSCPLNKQWYFFFNNKRQITYANDAYYKGGISGISYKLRVRKKKGGLIFIEIFEDMLSGGEDILLERFEVLDLRKDCFTGNVNPPPMYVMTLKRLYYKKPLTVEEYNNSIEKANK